MKWMRWDRWEEGCTGRKFLPVHPSTGVEVNKVLNPFKDINFFDSLLSFYICFHASRFLQSTITFFHTLVIPRHTTGQNRNVQDRCERSSQQVRYWILQNNIFFGKIKLPKRITLKKKTGGSFDHGLVGFNLGHRSMTPHTHCSID